MRLILLLCFVLCTTGCFTKTRTMQENTQVNLKAMTWAGEVQVIGTVDRTQSEQTEMKVNLPPALGELGGAVTTYLTGVGGIGALGMALYATIRRRKDLKVKDVESESKQAELAEQRDIYLRELCRGISKFMRSADDATVATLKSALKEEMSRDTRAAISDFI